MKHENPAFTRVTNRATPIGKLTKYFTSQKRTFERIALNVAFGSVADLEYIPKAAVQAAAIGGKADLAIRRKRPPVSGEFRETTRELERQVLAEASHSIQE